MWILISLVAAVTGLADGSIGAVDGSYEGPVGTLTAVWAQDSAKVTLCAGNACCIEGHLRRSGQVYQLIAKNADGLGCGSVTAGQPVATLKPLGLGNHRVAVAVQLRPTVKALKPFASNYRRQ